MPLLTHQLSADLSETLVTFSVEGLLDDSTTPARGTVNVPGHEVDFVILGYVYPFGISDRVARAFADAGLQGWTTRDLTLADWQGRPYSALVVTGRCGPVDLSRSTVTQQVGDFTWREGLFPVETEGDADFCLPDGRKNVLVTDAVAQCITTNQLTGATLTPLDKVTVIKRGAE